jgi:DNA-binding NarL/FixJ family response regulator
MAAAAGLQTCDVVDCLPRSDMETAKRECILLIEDNEEAMLLVRYALQEFGNGTYRLEWADGLTAGLHRLAKGGVDLVLLDLGLPETTGAASYACIRKAAPELPILVLTGDTTEQTEFAITSDGVEDYLVKDEVSGGLLLQAIRAALYSNRRWQEQKTSAYKQTQRFHWAEEKCQALYVLGLRLLKLHRIEAGLACGKAIRAIADKYGEAEGGTVDVRTDLLVSLERLARAATTQGHKDLARLYRGMITPPHNCDNVVRLNFDAAIRQRIAQLEKDPAAQETDDTDEGQPDLAVVLRQILETIPGLT